VIWPISNMAEMAGGHDVIMNGLGLFWGGRLVKKALKPL